MARIVLPKVPGAVKPPTPSSVAPGSRGPKRVKGTPAQPTEEDFKASSYKRRRPKATYPEYLVWDDLVRRQRMKPGEGFIEQYDLGQEIVGGIGAIIDFVIIDRYPYLAIPVQGSYWHKLYGNDFIYDLAQFSRVTSRKGWTLIPLQEDHLRKNAHFYVTEALKGNDLSFYAGKF